MKGDGNKKGEKSNKSSIKCPGGIISNTFVGGGVFFNLAKTIVSVLHKDLECGVEKLKYEKLQIMQQGGKRKVKSFFNCVTTMHQQMLFKYSLRHAAKVPKMPSTFMCTDVENYTAGNNWLR